MGAGIRHEEFQTVRRATESICRNLENEDHVVQPHAWISPPKWHLAHTTWFFEQFLLGRHVPGYIPRDPTFAYLFNSYYESAGPKAEKERRGAFSRPTVERVLAYRREVEESVRDLLASSRGGAPGIDELLEVGLHHERQHQELLIADIKAIFHFNPSRPAYGGAQDAFHPPPPVQAGPARWIGVSGGLREIGWNGAGFSFDNERPRHRVFLRDFRMQDRLADNGSYLAFIRDGGYARPELWLSEGWRMVRSEGWTAPLYWEEKDGSWSEFTPAGQLPLRMESPVCHVSYFEADAFARWSHARLPTEAEWETACDDGTEAGFQGMLGALWQWTASAYLPYPGFRALPGAMGEYNGKFMVDQMVLRGGSCATPPGHIRATYRNFFPAATRWQFSGIRLAEDL